jgi:hypothetical protein
MKNDTALISLTATLGVPLLVNLSVLCEPDEGPGLPILQYLFAGVAGMTFVWAIQQLVRRLHNDSCFSAALGGASVLFGPIVAFLIAVVLETGPVVHRFSFKLWCAYAVATLLAAIAGLVWLICRIGLGIVNRKLSD